MERTAEKMAADAIQRIKQAEQDAARLEQDGAQRKAEILTRAKKQADAERERMLRQAQEDAQRILHDAQVQVEEIFHRERSQWEEEIDGLKRRSQQRMEQAAEQLMAAVLSKPAGW